MAALLAVVTALLPVPAAADGGHDHDAGDTAGAVTAVADGLWSARSTWGGRVPAAGQTAVVPAGTTVVLDVSTPALAGLQVDGTLRFARRRLTLTSAYVMVHGALEVGTARRPFLQEATIVLDGPPTLDVHGMGTSVLGVMGGRLELHGRPRPVTWTRLARSARPGDRTVTVQDARGWRPGDRIVIASTDYDPTHAEERTIAAVDGRTLTLDPLAHHHHGRTDKIAGRRVRQRAEVGLLSRNIVVRGGPHAEHTRRGGHVMVHDGARARIDGVEFTSMGQSGVLGRYPVHFHHGGQQSGSSLRRSSIHHVFNRCVTVHDSHGVTIAHNVAYSTFGHCFFVEDGVETDNHFVRNLGLGTWVPPGGDALLVSDRHPATFWLSHPGNHLRGNVAAGSDGSGFWYDLAEQPNGTTDGLGAVNPREAAFGSFVGNVAHSNRNVGQFRSGSGLLVEDYRPPAAAVFSDFVAYANSDFGVWAEGITVTGATLTGNAVGFLGREATLNHSLVVGTSSNPAERLWSLTGVGFYHDTATIDAVTFANFKPHEWRHGVAIGSIVEHINALPRISRARFVNADRLRLPAPWQTDQPVGVGIVDADGSVLGSGRAATVVGDNPLIQVPGCRPAAEGHAAVCPTGLRVGFVQMLDESGARAKLGPVRVRRDDGAAAPAFSDPEWSSEPRSGTSVLMDHRYDFRPARTPRKLEWVLANSEPGWVELTVPWPHGTPYVYEGWGEWAQPLRPAADRDEFARSGGYRLVDGVVHVRFHGSEQWRWQRQMICVERGCGEGMGSRRE